MEPHFPPSKRAARIFLWAYVIVFAGTLVLLTMYPKVEHPALRRVLLVTAYCVGLPLVIVVLHHLLDRMIGKHLVTLQPRTTRQKVIFNCALVLLVLIAALLVALGALWLHERNQVGGS